MRYREIMEGLPLWHAKRWSRGRDRNVHQSVFDRFAASSPHNRRDRLYFPLDLAPEVKEALKVCEVSARELEELLAQHGITVSMTGQDYMDGYCTRDFRRVRIGKVLRALALDITNKQGRAAAKPITDARRAFEEHPARALAKLKGEPCWAVICRHGYDVAGMSTNRGWTSCFDLDDGEFVGDFRDEFRAGMVVAYMIREGDWNIQHPVARAAIAVHDGKFVPYESDPITPVTLYGVQSSTFGDFVVRWCAEANGSTAVTESTDPIQQQCIALWDWAAQHGVNLTVHHWAAQNCITLKWIKRHHGTPKGAGAEVIDAVCALADQHGLPVRLQAVSSTDTRALKNYYRRWGFVNDKGRNCMVRPARLQEDAHDDLIHAIRSTDPESVHGEHIAYHAQLKSEMPLPPETWLVHWTEYAGEVLHQGFTRGQVDPAVMGVTKGVSYAREPGYNFAYLAGSKDAKKGAGVYGHEAVLFRAAGVHIYHGGDDEEQVIFWGPDVKPNHMLLLCPDMTTPYWWEEATTWCVYTPDVSFTDGPDETSIPTIPPLAQGSFGKVMKWLLSR